MDGKDPINGRFLPGHKLAKGGANQGQQLKAALLAAETQERLLAIWEVVYDLALLGKPWAVKEYLNRTLGKAPLHVTLGGHGPLLDQFRESARRMVADPVIRARLEELSMEEDDGLPDAQAGA